ncbi:MAG: DUF892 family protein [Acidobacteria bacterium]|nr:DUF892 family protein [Acidobacteriota bacterium]
MAPGSLEALYLDDLGALHDGEEQMLRAMARFLDLARAPALRDALSGHLLESRLHLDRLALIFTHRNTRCAARSCRGVAGIVQEADDGLNEPATPDVRDAALVAWLRRLEHYEIAAYGTLRARASRLNRPDEVRLLHETLGEEMRADRRFAALEGGPAEDGAEPPVEPERLPARRLGFIDASRLDFSRLSRGPLEVLDRIGRTLGSVHGLVIALASQRSAYVVVAAADPGASKRMLPIGQVRFDREAGALRAHVEEDAVARYPPFDEHLIAAMTSDEIERYGRRAGLPEAPAVEDEPPLERARVWESDWTALVRSGLPSVPRRRQAPGHGRATAVDRSPAPASGTRGPRRQGSGH